jgi:hypothetical protein
MSPRKRHPQVRHRKLEPSSISNPLVGSGDAGDHASPPAFSCTKCRELPRGAPAK